jgi:nitronate monooxygenase
MTTTALLDLLKTRHPLIQAPMAGVQGSPLAIAVSQAGGLGSLPCAMLSPEQITTELSAIRAAGLAAYNVNFFCHVNPPADATHEATWRETLAPYYAEHGIDAASIPAGAGRNPFSAAVCDVIEPFKPPVVSFHFGLPSPELVARVKAWGAVVMSSATTVAEAQWLKAHGADVIIAQGLEAGGHRGLFLRENEHGAHAGLSSTHPHDWSRELSTQLPTFSLVPQITAAVNVPVVAAGGIVDAATVRAAMALGASGVQVGTAYMLCPEATTSAVHRAALSHSAAHPASHHTQLTTLFTGRPARGIVNRVMRELGPLNTAAPQFPTATAAIAPLRSAAEKHNSGDFSPLWSGQNASGCAALPAAEITRRLALGLSAS